MEEDNRRRIYYREDWEYIRSRLTIEQQLQFHEKRPEGNDRAATLWHAWHQNKQWLIRLLELTLASFPSYSRHDSSHADAVVHNIERILGEKRIASLSATDCFAILHTVYIHDIGMAILAEDRERIIMSDEFVEMVDDLAGGADKDLKNAALLMKKNVYRQETDEEIDFEGIEYHNEKKMLYVLKLDTYYAVVQLLAEYQRRYHGEKAASSVKDWIIGQDKLRSEFSMSGVPMRIFFRIADCAALHTDWEFRHILDLPWEENGYDNDMLHPRFVAVLLQLGDALDIDNDRFHPFAHAFAGSFPQQSEAHYNKHLAIRTLKITPEEIEIEADCETRETMRLVRNECDGIETLLKSASYYWSRIAPKGFGGALPSFKLSRLLLKGKEIPWDLALSRFQISQQKAFSFLQGENIYFGHFPFVRELLQNAIDSTKLQCYEDYRTSSKFRFEDSKKNLGKPGITNLSKIINPVEYPIEISISCMKLNSNDEYEEIPLDKIPETEDEKEKYGICFAIKDYGTGINTETLRNISDVGTSYKSRKKLLREMPDWLRPTGEFGIGLQSVFLVSDNFFCETYVRNGERYKIEFLTGANGKNGYINVEPKDPIADPMAFGTEFQVFINHEKKRPRTDCMDAWTGHDPFDQEYGGSQIKRDIIALTIQILMDIDSQLEDLLFPIFVSVKFNLGAMQTKLLESKLKKIVFSTMGRNGFTEENLKRHMCWIYQNAEECTDVSIRNFQIEKGVCRIDLSQMKMNLWLEDLAVSVCIGVDFVAQDNFQSIQSPCKFYYKGILIAEYNINKSGNLLESINIQGGRRGRKLIQLSRNGFTQEGLTYVDLVLIPRIYKSLFDVLRTLASQKFISAENMSKQMPFSDKIKENIKLSLMAALQIKEQNNAKAWQKQIVGISLYYNFYMREFAKRDLVYLSQREEYEKDQWNKAIVNVSNVVGKRRNDVLDIHSRLIVIEVHADLNKNICEVLGKREITIADFYNNQNKFAIVSNRRDKGDKWINNLIWLKNPEDIYMSAPVLTKLLESRVAERNQNRKWEEDLEKWADFMIENISLILGSQTIQQSNFVLALLQSVSISACFMDKTGNLKIHILSGQPLGSVYYNRYAKYKLLKRMQKRKQEVNAQRFAGSVWMGYELLQLSEIQEDICNIKEQYIQPSDVFMIFPCSGDAVQELVRYAEMSEEEYWFDERLEKSDQKETAVYLMDVKEVLREMAEMLYSCIVIKYEQIKDIDHSFFSEKYVEYCRSQGIRTPEISFWDLLNSSYNLALGTMLREELQKEARSDSHDSWRDLSIKSIRLEDLKPIIENQIPDKEDINILQGVIGICILENAESLWNGRELIETGGKGILEYMRTLKEYCIQWESLWSLVGHLQMELKTQEIKKLFKKYSNGEENLITWVSLQVHGERYGVEECYDRMWEELINAAIHQKENDMEEYIRLLNWMKVKEESLER